MTGTLNARVGVGAVIVNEFNQILLGRRVKSGEKPSWCLPGGHVEGGESFEAAAIRETREETGLTCLTHVQTIALCVNTGSTIPNLTAAVVAKLEEQNAIARVMEGEVFSEWGWFESSDLPQPCFPATSTVLALYLRLPLPSGWACYDVQPSG